MQVYARQLDASVFPSLPEIPFHPLLHSSPETPPPSTTTTTTTTPSQPLVEAWLPQYTSINTGENYKLLSQPINYGAVTFNALLDATMTGEEYLASTGIRNISSIPPIPLPVFGGAVANMTHVVARASDCARHVPYKAGPAASRTVCQLVACFASGECGTCSGAFVADPTWYGRMLFLTAAHCTARSETDTIDMSKSIITCNGTFSGAPDGFFFRPLAVAVSRIDFSKGFGISDGALMQVQGLSDTELAYSKPLAVAAITTAGLATSISIYTGGFPREEEADDGRQRCNSTNLGNPEAIHFTRIFAGSTLVDEGIAITRLHGCGGSSGSVIFDEEAGVLFGVLSASGTWSCVSTGTSTSVNLYSRVIEGAVGRGVPFLGLVLALSPGQVVFRN